MKHAMTMCVFLAVRAVTALSFTVGLAVMPAIAADAPAKKAPAKPATKGKNVMTRDELRACMLEQDRLEKISGAIKKEQPALDQQLADVRKLDADIAQKRAALDPNDATALQSLNADEMKRDSVAEAYNTRLAALREQGSTFETGRKAWVERCANRDYDEMDEAVIKREMRRAAGAPK